MKTSTGFPIRIKSPYHLLSLLKKHNAHIDPVATHHSTEKGTKMLHHFMWKLEKEKNVTVDSKIDSESGSNDTIFMVSLTMKGLETIKNARIYYFTLITMIMTFISIILWVVFR